MSDFRARIIAELDDSKIPSQISKIADKNTFVLKKIKLDTSGLPSQIQASLDNHKFTISLDGIKMSNIDNQLKSAGESAGESFSQSLVNRITTRLNNGKIESAIAQVTSKYENLSYTGDSRLSSISENIKKLNELQKAMNTASSGMELIGNYTEFNDVLTKVRNNLTTVASEVKKTSSEAKLNLDAGKMDVSLVSVQTQFNKLRKETNADLALIEPHLNELVRLTDLLGDTSKLSTDEILDAYNKWNTELNTVKNSLFIVSKTAEKLDTASRLEKVNEIKIKVNEGDLSASLASVQSQFKKLGEETNADLSSTEPHLNELVRLTDLLGDTSKLSTDEVLDAYEKWNTELNTVKNNLSTASSTSKKFVSSTQIQSLDSKMSDWLRKNTKASKEFGDTIRSLRERLAQLAQAGNVTEDELKEIADAFAKTDYQADQLGQKGASLGSTLKGAFGSLLRYFSVSTIIYQAANAIKQMSNNVVEINREMTELKKVTDETGSAYKKFLQDASVNAQRIGTTIKDYVSSTADFARLGYSMNEASQLAEIATVYSVVGDEIENVDTASKSIISTMTAFNISTSDALSIVDKFNKVGNEFAISSGGIGDALQRSASSLSAANNDLNQSIALITAAKQVG